jgi:ribose-phosphate pyrophosphokinase
LINLTKNFEPLGIGIDFEEFWFPSKCEYGIKTKQNFSYNTITCRIKSSDDIIRILMATNALKNQNCKNIELFIPYLPYARQDRIMVNGEAFSLKVLADILNIQNYSKVTFYDVHSSISNLLINNSVSISNSKFVSDVLPSNSVIVCPDAGATKKIYDLCKDIKYNAEIVFCNKIRDVSTGKIIRLSIAESDVVGQNCVIVDDICDGGATFSMIGEKLKQLGAKSVSLIVSHGIFSGEIPIKNIDHVYTTDSFYDGVSTDYITVKQLKEIL